MRGRSRTRSTSRRRVRARRVSPSPRALTTIPTQVGYDFSRAVQSRRRCVIHKGMITVPTNATEAYGAYAFTLQDVPGYQSLQAVYDEFRIDYVKVNFIMAEAPATYLVAAIDLNDVTAPTAQSQVVAMETCRTIGPTGTLTMCVRPQTDGQEWPMRPFLSTNASSATQYRGVKWAAYTPYASTTSSIPIADVYCEYWISYRKSK